MREINLSNIHLTDLKLFLAAAEYGSFTKAGEKMFMTQSWVSRRINLIENRLGLQLFTRSKREIILTPAGRVLKQRLEGVTDGIIGAFQAAHAAQTGATGSLCLGFLEWGTLVFIKQLERFIEQNPNIDVEVYRQPFHELRTNISLNRMDLNFITSYESDEMSAGEYNILRVRRVPLVAYMHKNHPLAAKGDLELEELRAEPILMVDDKSSSGYSNYIRGLFLERDIRPLIAQYAHDGGVHIGNILINKGILLASRYFLENCWGDQIARPRIRGVDLFVTAVWKKQNTNPALMNFLRCISESGDLPAPDSGAV